MRETPTFGHLGVLKKETCFSSGPIKPEEVSVDQVVSVEVVARLKVGRRATTCLGSRRCGLGQVSQVTPSQPWAKTQSDHFTFDNVLNQIWNSKSVGSPVFTVVMSVSWVWLVAIPENLLIKVMQRPTSGTRNVSGDGAVQRWTKSHRTPCVSLGLLATVSSLCFDYCAGRSNKLRLYECQIA